MGAPGLSGDEDAGVRTHWTRRADGLAFRVNLGWALALGAPRVGGVALVGAAAVLLLRRGQASSLWLAVVVWAALVVAGAWTLRALWPRRYRRADALARLDAEGRLGGALVAAAEQAAPWPPPGPPGPKVTWRLARVAPGFLAAPALLLAALLVPVGSATPAAVTPEGRPLAWGKVEDALQILEAEPLVAEAEVERWKAQLAALEQQPPEAWFSHEGQEAADALWAQLRSTVARAEAQVAPLERALAEDAAAQDAAARDPSASAQALEDAVARAKAGAQRLDSKLAERLAKLDPKDLPGLSQDAKDSLQQELARARMAGRRARQAQPGQGEGEGTQPGPGQGAPLRGPGTAPIDLMAEAARRDSERSQRVDGHDDPARDRLGDTVRRDAVAPEVDEASYQGAMSGGSTPNLGQGGAVVWKARLRPSEQAALQQYFRAEPKDPE